MIIALEKRFQELHPEVKVKDINVTSGEHRAVIKTMLLGGETVDLIFSAWPSFDKELHDAGLLVPIDTAWQQYGWDKSLNESWKKLGTIEGKIYGAWYLADNRSGVWYDVKTFEKLGLSVPATWDEFRSVARAYKEAGMVPIILGAKIWAHTDVFENLLLRVGGPEMYMKLAWHEIPWNHQVVRNALKRWQELLTEGLFPDANTMLATDWFGAFQQVIDTKTAGLNLMGSWVNVRAQQEFKLVPGEDYNFFQFPVIDPKLPKNTTEISGKDWLVTKTGKNRDAAFLFIDFVLSREGGGIIAEYGSGTPNRLVPLEQYDAVMSEIVKLFAANEVVFVLDDLLPSELSNEFRTQLQKFLMTPTDETIETVMAAIEQKAKEVY